MDNENNENVENNEGSANGGKSRRSQGPLKVFKQEMVGGSPRFFVVDGQPNFETVPDARRWLRDSGRDGHTSGSYMIARVMDSLKITRVVAAESEPVDLF